MKFKYLIVDDEPLARKLIAAHASKIEGLELVGECGNAIEAANLLRNKSVDLIFLDIQMPKINGFEMLELLESPPSVIFTTAFDEFAIKAFEHHAVDYLLKPFNQERLDMALRKWKENQPQTQKNTAALVENSSQPDDQQRIVVKKGVNIVILPIHVVHYIEAFDDYVKVYTKDGFYLKKKTMAHYEKSLDPRQFVRVHRSYLLNIQELTRIEPMEKDSHVALLKSGVRIPLSQSGYGKLKEVLGI